MRSSGGDSTNFLSGFAGVLQGGWVVCQNPTEIVADSQLTGFHSSPENTPQLNCAIDPPNPKITGKPMAAANFVRPSEDHVGSPSGQSGPSAPA